MSTNTNHLDEVPIAHNQVDLNEERSERARKRSHIIYTCALYYSFIAVGLCYSIFNPTLVQLSTVFGSDLEHTSMIFPSRSVGSTLGTLTNGFLNQFFNRQTLLFSCLLLKATTTFLVPHFTTVEAFCINGFFNGFFTSAIVVMVNVWLNELWSWSARRRQQEEKRRKLGARQNGGQNHYTEIDLTNQQPQTSESKIDIGNVLMQALHFFFGVGCILGPLLAEPFLQHPFMGQEGFFSNCLVLPYTIASCTSLISCMSFFILFLVCPYDQPNLSSSAEESDSDESQLLPAESTGDVSVKRPVSRQLRYLIIFSSAVFLFVFICSEGTYFQFSASFATKTKLHLSEPNAALLASSLAISFTVFRALSVLIALKLTPGMMILLDLITVAIGNSLVYTFADTNLVLFTIGIILLGAGFASVFPSFFPFLEHHGFAVTDMVGSLLTFAGGLSETLAPFIVGKFIDTKPYVLVYFSFLSVTLSSIALGALNALIWFVRSPASSSSTTNPPNRNGQQPHGDQVVSESS